MNEVIKYIKTSNIYPHPDNPRKELGDLEELVESIKKNGIMQNLTVIPITALSKPPEEQPAAEEISVKSDFHALIGHRRLAAVRCITRRKSGEKSIICHAACGSSTIYHDVRHSNGICDGRRVK